MGKKSKKKFKAEAGAPAPENTKRDKKQAVMGSSNSGGDKKSAMVGLGIALAVIIGVGIFLFGGSSASPFKAVKAEAGVVSIPLSEVDDGHAHFFTYNGSKSVNFFVLRSSDGVIRAAFDACDVCYQEKKGYHQEGDIMVCNNCGQRFPSVKINVLRGGCNPAPLDRTVQGDTLVLRADDIEKGAFYF